MTMLLLSFVGSVERRYSHTVLCIPGTRGWGGGVVGESPRDSNRAYINCRIGQLVGLILMY